MTDAAPPPIQQDGQIEWCSMFDLPSPLSCSRTSATCRSASTKVFVLALVLCGVLTNSKWSYGCGGNIDGGYGR